MDRLYSYRKFLKNSIILSGIFLLFTALNASQSEEEYSPRNTPSPISEVSTIVEQTPGQRARSMQREFLTEENFTAVLSEEGKRKLADKGINWTVFTDLEKEYDDPAIRSNMRMIKLVLDGEIIESDAFNILYVRFSRIFNTAKMVSQTRIEEITTGYFKGKFPDCSVSLSIKRGGVQMGTTALVSFRETDVDCKFYVKTHSLGLLSEKSTAAKPFDPAEFVVYRILQGFGLGCETHLFGRDQREFYIATLDAGTGGCFEEYAKIKRSTERMENLCGVLSGCLSLDTPTEEVISHDEVAQNYIRHIVSLDLLARMLRLGDLQSNGGNFGFFASEENDLMQLRIIDFRLLDDKRRDYTWDHWGGFLEGNGLFVPTGVDRTMRYTLRGRDRSLRVREAYRLFNSVFANYESVCDVACGSVNADIPEEIYVDDRSEVVTYGNTVKTNFRIFKQFCENYE